MVKKCKDKTWCGFVSNPPRKKWGEHKFYIAIRTETKRLNNEFWWETSFLRKTIWGIIKFCTNTSYFSNSRIRIYEFDFKDAKVVYDGLGPKNKFYEGEM